MRGDFAARKSLEKKISRDPSVRTDEIAALLAGDDAATRRVGVELLRRRIATDEEAYSALCGRYERETDIKARRRIAAALGESERAEAVPLLRAWLEGEPHRFAQASLILALGSLGHRDWSEEWRAGAGGKGPVAEAMRTVLRAAETGGEARRATVLAHSPGRYFLRTAPGLEGLCQVEATERGLGSVRMLGAGWLSLEDPLDAARAEGLGGLLLVSSVHRHLPLEVDSDGDGLKSAIARACLGVKGELSKREFPLRFRVTTEGRLPNRRRRSLLKSWARAIEVETGWINDPASFDVELMHCGVDDLALEGPVLLVRDMNWIHPRIGEVRKTVDASMHPVVAAALCRWAAGDERPPEGALFLDPCVGSGTSLREWVRAFPTTRATGFDRSRKAVAVAKHNLRGLGGRAEVRVGDMRSLPTRDGEAWAMVANLPFGIRSGRRSDNAELYRAMLQEARRALREGGRFAVYTHDSRRLRDAAEAIAWRIGPPVATVSTGGLEIPAFILRA
jgi:SAM-dependent methyltransferase